MVSIHAAVLRVASTCGIDRIMTHCVSISLPLISGLLPGSRTVAAVGTSDNNVTPTCDTKFYSTLENIVSDVIY